jgi:DNA-dependent metalloprotease WSS1
MSYTRSGELEPLVNSFEHLSDKSRASEALDRLRKIASQVKPLMRQRNWRVGTLAEFYPADHTLLGMNHNRGEMIQLRLRHAGDDTQFLPIENVVDTMLHELAHIVQGPHDELFHALWDKLRDEHEALLRKGYTGEGFLGRGQRLGGQRIPMSEVRRKARAAAEIRRDRTAGSGQKLGGQGIQRGQDARSVIADAVEKRLKIEKGCGTNNDRGRRTAREEGAKKKNVTRTTVEHEDEHEAAVMQAYIELIQEEEQQKLGKHYIPPSQANPAGSKSTPTSPRSLVEQQRSIEQSLRSTEAGQNPPTFTPPPGPPPKKPKQESSPRPIPSNWTCDICTLINPMSFLSCDACGTERPDIFNASLSPSPPRHTPSSNTPPQNSTKSKDRAQAGLLRPKTNAADNLRKFDEQGAYKKNLPIGWKCSCGNFMEQEWWTCARCGRMKPSS